MENLIVSSSPHANSKTTTRRIMADVIIALAPAAIASVVLYGVAAFVTLAVCVGTCVLSEFIFNACAKKDQTIGDLSAIVTGILLALSLPKTAGIWPCIVGSVFAIVVVKCLFGGIGCNFANPAVTARILLLVSFGASVGGGTATLFQGADFASSATPMEIINNGADGALPTLIDMLLGNRGGAIGEGCIVALLIGGIYLLARKVIKWHTPVIFIATVFVLSLIVLGDVSLALYEVLGGGVVIAAFFMATDYSTTPINARGKMVFALGCGVFTVLIRFLGAYPEGVSFAILIMNILAPYIEKLCAKKPFGKAGKTA